tara:strand:+ start:404 stop:595 length:192 start_codon:yes stop_codon:yes gene_type:complete
MTIANYGDGNGYVSQCGDCGTLGLDGRYADDIARDLKRMGWEIMGEDDGVTYADAYCPACAED